MISVPGAFAVGIAVGTIGAVVVCTVLFACCEVSGRWSDAERGE